VWFAFDESRPLAFFAGIWTRWTSVRKVREGVTENDLFAFLTTEPNAVVAPIHPKAMPVILTTDYEIETWLTAPASTAMQLQRPLPDDALKVVARGEKLTVPWRSLESAMGRKRTEQPPPKSRPYTDPPRAPLTLAEIRKNSCWVWAYCRKSGRIGQAPIAIAPFIIRWGATASSDLLRRSLRCSTCGGKGCTLRHPSWMGMDIGVETFPSKRQR
jgi:hypothetical protein